MNDEKTRSRSSRRARGAGTAVLAALFLGGAVAAAHAAEAPAPKQTLAAGARYEASGFHRFFLGSGYRDLWTLPIEVEVLDLASWSGGLVAEKKGGGRQTQALRFEGADGREWRFRSVDKDPTAVLPSALKDSFAARIVQDQISASHPLGVLVVDALADAVGLPHVEHRLVVLPDDPRLGEFREEFRGMLGTLEENPSVKSPVTPGFERFTKIVDTDELEELLDADPGERVDSRSLLRARLVDLVIGDSDRHRSQWDWARDAESGRFVAVPQDRDLAFVKFDGPAAEAGAPELGPPRELRGRLSADRRPRLAGAPRRQALPLGPRVDGMAGRGRGAEVAAHRRRDRRGDAPAAGALLSRGRTDDGRPPQGAARRAAGGEPPPLRAARPRGGGVRHRRARRAADPAARRRRGGGRAGGIGRPLLPAPLPARRNRRGARLPEGRRRPRALGGPRRAGRHRARRGRKGP